jgi:hypothetical protein
MFRALGAQWMLPVHHSTFRLSREPVEEPVRRLLAAAGEERWRVLPTDVGATWMMPPMDHPSAHPSGSPG